MPVYQDAVVFLGLAVTMAFALVLVSARLILWRRDVHRRLGVLVARVTGDWEPGLSLEELLTRLEFSTDRANRDDTPVAPIATFPPLQAVETPPEPMPAVAPMAEPEPTPAPAPAPAAVEAPAAVDAEIAT